MMMMMMFNEEQYACNLFDRISLRCLMIILFLQQIDAHGRMEDPPARNAAWRYGN